MECRVIPIDESMPEKAYKLFVPLEELEEDLEKAAKFQAEQMDCANKMFGVFRSQYQRKLQIQKAAIDAKQMKLMELQNLKRRNDIIQDLLSK